MNGRLKYCNNINFTEVDKYTVVIYENSPILEKHTQYLGAKGYDVTYLQTLYECMCVCVCVCVSLL